MSWFDFNDAPKMGGELIPAGTVAPVVMTLRSGGSAADPMLRQSQSSDALMLDVEFTITEGDFARRKIWQLITVDGGSRDENGNSKGGQIGRAWLRAAIESSKGIAPTDNSPAAQQARRVNGYQDFDGLSFLAKIGVQKDKTGVYSDKNTITPVTPNMKEWGNQQANTTPWGALPTPAAQPGTTTPAPAGQAPWASNNQPAGQASSNGAPSWAQ